MVKLTAVIIYRPHRREHIVLLTSYGFAVSNRGVVVVALMKSTGTLLLLLLLMFEDSFLLFFFLGLGTSRSSHALRELERVLCAETRAKCQSQPMRSRVYRPTC